MGGPGEQICIPRLVTSEDACDAGLRKVGGGSTVPRAATTCESEKPERESKIEGGENCRRGLDDRKKEEDTRLRATAGVTFGDTDGTRGLARRA